ncbi:MAG: transposase [Bacteroidetes bacterium]|nr:MAG: transposase [Bacteroidota bacterium]
MQITHHIWERPNLVHPIRLNRYGTQGMPLLAFPAQEGNHRNWEDFGLLNVLAPYIEAERLQVFTLDSYDAESWTSRTLPPHERGPRYEAYVHLILSEVVPWIQRETHQLPYTSGVSMGAYHAANLLFRFPHSFAGCIALSGVYELSEFLGEYADDFVYFNSPLWFLPNLEDPYYLNELRQKTIILCVGQGDWEEPMLTQTRRMKAILEAKGIPAWVDIWGPDVHHDWPWWYRQLPYFLDKVLSP